MSEWKTYQLQEVASVQTGPFGSQLHQSDYVDVGTPIITVEHLGENRITHNNLPRLTDEDKQRLKKYWLQEGDIVFSRVGSVDRRAYVKKDEDGWLFSGRCLRVRPKNNIDGKYLSYFFGLEDFKKKIRSVAVGATMPSLNTSIMNEIEVILPNEKIQTQIASILSSLDDKIELNLQMNQTLEAMAQAIFKEWFVNFNFPGFDGELVDGLPKGWKMGKLGDVCERITKGTTPTTLKKQFVEKGINFIKAEGIDDIGNFIPEKFAFIDEETNEMLKRSIIQENDIVFTIAGTLGRVAKVDKSILPANTNQAVAIIRVADNEMVNFVYHLLRSDLIKSTLISKAVHAVQANISLGVLSAADIVIPKEKIIQLFNDILNPIEEKLLSNVYETRTLTQIRDSLLPKLMTGKIEIQA